MIDLRKNKSKIFFVDKESLEVLEGVAHQNILGINMSILFVECAGIYGFKKEEYNMYKNYLNHYVKITRDEYKEFRKMDEESKKLFIMIKEF